MKRRQFVPILSFVVATCALALAAPIEPKGKILFFTKSSFCEHAEFIRSGKDLVGTHSASDNFRTNNESKKWPDRYPNHGQQADSYVRFLGGEFIKHGARQEARNTVENTASPRFATMGKEHGFTEECYSLKDFSPHIHVLSVINDPFLNRKEYERPHYPSTWARREGNGRAFYTAMGHREHVCTHPTFQSILDGALQWANGDVKADIFRTSSKVLRRH